MKNTYGAPQMIRVQLEGGAFADRLMKPVLDDQGNWTSWVPATQEGEVELAGVNARRAVREALAAVNAVQRLLPEGLDLTSRSSELDNCGSYLRDALECLQAENLLPDIDEEAEFAAEMDKAAHEATLMGRI